MKESKTPIIILFILLAIPIPFSLMSWIGILISVANIGITKWSEFSECIQALVSLITMFIAGTYLITYIISLGATLKNKKISLISFLSILHIILFIIFLLFWTWLEAINKV